MGTQATTASDGGYDLDDKWKATGDDAVMSPLPLEGDHEDGSGSPSTERQPSNPFDRLKPIHTQASDAVSVGERTEEGAGEGQHREDNVLFDSPDASEHTVWTLKNGPLDRFGYHVICISIHWWY
jgi:hypothetical protein